MTGGEGRGEKGRSWDGAVGEEGKGAGGGGQNDRYLKGQSLQDLWGGDSSVVRAPDS